MAKTMYLAMNMVKHPVVKLGSQEVKIGLPTGAVGLCYVFKTKKAAREWFDDKDIELRAIKKYEDELSSTS